MVLSFDAYTETIEERAQKESEVKTLSEKYEKEMKEMRGQLDKIVSLIQENPKLARVKRDVIGRLR